MIVDVVHLSMGYCTVRGGQFSNTQARTSPISETLDSSLMRSVENVSTDAARKVK